MPRVLRRRDDAERGVLVRPHSTNPALDERVDDELALLARSGRSALRAVGDGPAGDGSEVLDRYRHPEERRVLASLHAAVGVLRGGAGVVVVAPGDGAQLRIALVHGRQALLEQLDGGDLAPADRGGELERG